MVNASIVLLIGIIIILGARRFEMLGRRPLKRIRPWLSKYLPYSDETGLPVIFLRSKTGNSETWLFRFVGVLICVAALYNMLNILL
jgi:hypothetical protein